MFSTRIRLFRFFGIPIGLDLSWLIILALLTWTMAAVFQNPPEALQQLYPPGGLGLTTMGYLVMGLLAALAFFVCILLHELGHALVARANGMPIRGITLFLFGGVAEMESEPPSAGSEFAMAIAGPLVSFVLAIGFALLAWAGYQANWEPVAVVVFAYLASINLTVLLFNLVPAFPLDGGRVLRSILWAAMGRLRRATHIASIAGQVFAWFLIFLGVMQLFNGDFIGGIWLGLIGMFLNSAAQSSYQQVVVKQALEGEPVRRFMNPQPILVPPNLNLHEFVEEYVYRYHHKFFPVGSEGRVDGFVTTQLLSRYARAEWGYHTVEEVMERNLKDISITPDSDATQALNRIQRTGQSRLLVFEGDKLVGIVSLKDLMRFLNLKLEMEGPEGEKRPEAPGMPRFPRRQELPARR